MYIEDEDKSKTEFHIPCYDDQCGNDRDIVRQVSISEHSPLSFIDKTATSSSLELYEELNAVSKEVMACRKAALSHIA